MEYDSGWPEGRRTFPQETGAEDVPLVAMTFLVLKGPADMEHAGRQVAMSACPARRLSSGTASPAWTTARRSLTPCRPGFSPPKDEAGKAFVKKAGDVIARFADEAAKAKSVNTVIEKFLASDNPLDRRLAVAALAATDQRGTQGARLYASRSDRTCGKTRCWRCVTGFGLRPRPGSVALPCPG